MTNRLGPLGRLPRLFFFGLGRGMSESRLDLEFRLAVCLKPLRMWQGCKA